MKIYITGTNGEIGSYIYRELMAVNMNIIRIIRTGIADNNTLKYNYSGLSNNEVIDENGCIVIHCGYDFKDKDVDLNNNYNIINNLITLFPNCYFINISTISAFDGAKSKYGKIKRNIEIMIEEFGGINLRLGVPIAKPAIGVLRTIEFIERFLKFSIIISLPNTSLLYTTNMKHYVGTIIFAINNKNAGTFSVIDNSSGVTFRDLVLKNDLPCLHLPFSLVFYVFKFIEFIGIDIRFGSDSLLSMTCTVPEIVNPIMPN